MNQRVKRAIAAAMSLTMVATATPVSPLYNAIQNAVSNVMMQASAGAADNEYIVNYDNTDTFSIASFDDLNMFAEAVNGGKTFENKTITLADSFDMGTNALTTPIGTYKHIFMGTFDGNNKTIKLNIESESAEGYAGLFGYVDGATIRNITVTGYADCDGVAGGICGFAASSNIYNCANIAEVTGYSAAGGICGYAGGDLNVYSCTNNAAVNGTNGICGYAGGILGYADEDVCLSVYNCANIATVTSKYGAGGICGYSFFSLSIHNCINIAAVINISPALGQTTDIGGICGGSNGYLDIDNCYLLDVNTKFDEEDGVTEITAEKLAGTDKVSDNKTLTELLNANVDKFNSILSNDIKLLEWEQGQDYPILKIPVPQDAYTEIEGTNLKWKLEDDGKLTIELKNPDETDLSKNAMPDWEWATAPWNDVSSSITSVEIKEGVISIGNDAFINCSHLKSVTIGNGVESIGDYAFYLCSGLTSVTIPDCVTSIGINAFHLCSGLTSVTIPDKVTSIGRKAFLDCESLESITFEGDAPTIGYSAFSNVGKTTSATLYYPKDNTTWETFLETAKSEGKIDESGVLSWQGGKFKAEAYLNWNDIADTNLHWAISVNGTLYIEPKDKTATTGNAMPDYGNEQTMFTNTIPWRIIKNSIKSVEIKNGVTKIGFGAFWSYPIKSVTLPESIEYIGGYAFKGTDLESVIIPDSVTSISMGTFYGCSSLKSVTLPDNIESIGNSAFYGCSSLKSVTLPDSIEYIDDFAFEETGLTSITIPKNVKTIGDGAFNQCLYLDKIIFEGDVPETPNEPKYNESYGYTYDLRAFTAVGTPENPVMLYYPKGNTTWETFLADNASNITNGVLSWEGGYFKAEAYLNWNDIADTNLHWAISENGTLYIDKQETPSGSNFTVPDFDDNAPWKDSISKINRVEIAKDVTNISTKSFKGFEAPTILVLEDGYNGTKPTAFANSTYSSFGGGEFIYKTQAVGASLSLDGQIGVNISFYVNKDEGSTITINGKTVDLSECECNGDIYTYTLWVAPKDAYNDITFKTVKDSDTIVEQTYSVKANYVDDVLTDTSHVKYSEKDYNMVRALDTYINSSRVYFDIEKDNDKIAKLKTEIDTAYESADKAALNDRDKITKAAAIDNNKVEYYGSSLILDSGVKLRHYIKVTNEADISNFKVNNLTVTDGKIIKSNIKSDSYDVYYFETDEFNPLNYDTNLSVTYDDINVISNYSVLSYIKLALNKNADSKLGTICKALYNYYLEAKDFKN